MDYLRFPGIYTGSVYNDRSLRLNGFPGEICSNGSVVVVKTHKMPAIRFERAVLIIRDPYGAILSEFKRGRGNHTSLMAISVLETGGEYRGVGGSGRYDLIISC